VAIRFPRPVDHYDDPWHRQERARIAWELAHAMPFDPPPTENALMELHEILSPAVEIEPRMKLFMFGASGVGKSYSALEIATAIGGKIAVHEPEKGSRLYAGKFPYYRIKTDDLDTLTETIRTLAQGGHDYRTLIIDPITLLWRSWQEQWERRFLAKNTGRKGHRGEWYEMGMKDWAPIKRTWEAFMRTLTDLDMNVIATAREKAEYEGSGNSLRKVGETFDGEKGLDYWFDTVLRLELTGSGKRLATTLKDRTGSLEQSRTPWEFTSRTVATAFGGSLDRNVARTLVSAEELEEIRAIGVDLDISESELTSRARERFGVPTIDELSPEDATEVLEGMRAAVAAQNEAKTSEHNEDDTETKESN
jgi:hypothetical protein